MIGLCFIVSYLTHYFGHLHMALQSDDQAIVVVF